MKRAAPLLLALFATLLSSCGETSHEVKTGSEISLEDAKKIVEAWNQHNIETGFADMPSTVRDDFSYTLRSIEGYDRSGVNFHIVNDFDYDNLTNHALATYSLPDNYSSALNSYVVSYEYTTVPSEIEGYYDRYVKATMADGSVSKKVTRADFKETFEDLYYNKKMLIKKYPEAANWPNKAFSDYLNQMVALNYTFVVKNTATDKITFYSENKDDLETKEETTTTYDDGTSIINTRVNRYDKGCYSKCNLTSETKGEGKNIEAIIDKQGSFAPKEYYATTTNPSLSPITKPSDSDTYISSSGN